MFLEHSEKSFEENLEELRLIGFRSGLVFRLKNDERLGKERFTELYTELFLRNLKKMSPKFYKVNKSILDSEERKDIAVKVLQSYLTLYEE